MRWGCLHSSQACLGCSSVICLAIGSRPSYFQMDPTALGPANKCSCECGFCDGTKDQWSSLLGGASFIPVLYCGLKSLLFIHVQRLHPGNFTSFKKRGEFFLIFPEVKWVENTNKRSTTMSPPLWPQAATFSHSPLDPYKPGSSVWSALPPLSTSTHL